METVEVREMLASQGRNGEHFYRDTGMYFLALDNLQKIQQILQDAANRKDGVRDNDKAAYDYYCRSVVRLEDYSSSGSRATQTRQAETALARRCYWRRRHCAAWMGYGSPGDQKDSTYQRRKRADRLRRRRPSFYCLRANAGNGRVNYYLFDLVCRNCGEKLKRRMTQFDSLPECPKCGSEMLAENAKAI